MKKHGKKTKGDIIDIVYISVFLVVGLLVGIIISLVVAGIDKKAARRQMQAVMQYVKEQCVRYEELNYESVLRDLYTVSDRAFDIREHIDLSSESVSDELREHTEDGRLNGVIVTGADGSVVASYCDGEENISEWLDYINTFDSVAGKQFKSYSERRTINDYYYDCTIVSREDGEGVVLCYKRQKVQKAEDSRFSVSTLLDGFVFGTNGVIVVSDGTMILGSNVSGKVGTASRDISVVRQLIESGSVDDFIKVYDDTIYYATRSKCKDTFIYAYRPWREIFSRSFVVLPCYVAVYILAGFGIVSIKRAALRKRQIEQDKIDAAFRAENDRLAKEAIIANEAKTDFLRRMSHDLRTPINGIRGMVKIGEYYYEDAEKQKECRRKIWDASNYLLDLVNDILDMNKLTTESTVWKDESFVMSKLIEEVGSFVSIQAKEAGITVNVDAGGLKHDYLFGGKVQFKRVITNLMVNAVKYNKPHGSVNVRLTETGDKDGIAYFTCVCADDGIGMSEEFLAKMYEPFEREKKSDEHTSDGMGLGLAIVKKIVDKRGWSISAESIKGKGTVFTLGLSFKIEESPAGGEESVLTDDLTEAGEEKRLAGRNVLVAEDNKLNFEIVEFILNVAGANVIYAENGQQAVDKFLAGGQGEIDVILMDVMMPVLDGLAATRAIRSSDHKDASSVPIIAMTASAFADDVENARKAGMDAHISKPIDGEKLIKCILRLLDEKFGGGTINNES